MAREVHFGLLKHNARYMDLLSSFLSHSPLQDMLLTSVYLSNLSVRSRPLFFTIITTDVL